MAKPKVYRVQGSAFDTLMDLLDKRDKLDEKITKAREELAVQVEERKEKKGKKKGKDPQAWGQPALPMAGVEKSETEESSGA